VFGAAATAHGKSTHAIALAWLRSLSPMMVPIPGVTRVETVLDNLSGLKITLSEQEQAEINEKLPTTLPMDAELLADQPKN
jgi:aryl-alcohol dehydrogenase-like predicted oxidoreductase